MSMSANTLSLNQLGTSRYGQRYPAERTDGDDDERRSSLFIHCHRFLAHCGRYN